MIIAKFTNYIRYVKRILSQIVEYFIYYFFRIGWVLVRKQTLAFRKDRIMPKLLFGPTPIINNKYWAKSMENLGYYSKSVTQGLPVINKKDDFDLHIDDLFPIIGRSNSLKLFLQQFKMLDYVVRNYDILIISFKFHFIGNTRFWKKEILILKSFGIKTVIIPYGSDYYMYSKFLDHSVKHNMFVNNYQDVFNEEHIFERVTHWKNNADFVIMAIMLDAAPRWDALPVNALVIDVKDWIQKIDLKLNNGLNGVVRITHTPNHRGIKGTEYIISAVEELKADGFLIELILIEGQPNTEVKRTLFEESDIHVDQIIMTGYALSAIEGMSSGLPVIANLESKEITQVLRRYSYLNECPILSASPENIKDQIKLLVQNPSLRRELGNIGREYVEKYHSYETGQYFFKTIINKIWFNKDVDTLNMFHPLSRGSYNNKFPKLNPPLVNNHFKVQA